MLTLLSPAKTLDFDTPFVSDKLSQPVFLDQSALLIDELKQLSPDAVGKLMKLSSSLAQLNAGRFQAWQLPFTPANAKAALLAFKGDVYQGLNAETFNQSQLAFAQTHLRILSGLYGVLKPLDLIQAYRLEMGTGFANQRGKNLYEFWGERITEHLNEEVKRSGSQVIINLASNEYFSAVKPKLLQAELITPVFKDEKNGQYKIISFYAKKARGFMARWIIENNLNDATKLHQFNLAGYRFDDEQSQGNTLVFKRAEKDITNA
ncbi:MAG: peroxide stress protein YaaA [Venatoribacter sp.]